jgi:hemerythrin-like domain-containing protein
MAFIHNIFIRNINAIVLQFENLSKPQDISDFLVFCQAWHESVHLHHHGEEEFFFPAIEAYSGEKGIMEINVKQHHEFHDGLKKFGEYVYGTTAETYDVQTFKEILDSFTPALMQHFTDEIHTLLSLEKYGGEKLKKTWDDLEKRLLALKIDFVFALIH